MDAGLHYVNITVFSLQGAVHHSPGACVFEQTSFHGQASEDVGYEVDDENRPVEKLETGIIIVIKRCFYPVCS